MLDWLSGLTDALQEHSAVCFVTVLEVRGSAPRDSGAKMVVTPDDQILGSVGGGNLEKECRSRALELLADFAAGEASTSTEKYRLCPQVHQCCGGTVQVFFEVIPAPASLCVFGAGHVAHEVVDVVRGLDFAITVVDPRVEWNNLERFPRCTRVLSDPVTFAAGLRRGFALVMTHDHDLDFRLLEILLARRLAYVGLIGSQAKKRKLLARLPEVLTQRVVSPVGLAIGGKTPREIAVSIAAEFIALRNGAWRPGEGIVRMCELPSPITGPA